ncbi:MAG: penicillin-binding protein 2, partial [Armatimonadota bacterium]|nr:penicillin-binding protein 2 [Armatimonadota bacterium]
AYYQKEADSYRVSKQLLPAWRGSILDRNGASLAINVPAVAVYADPLEVKDAAGAASVLAPLLGEDAATLQKLLTPRSPKNHYVSLKRHIDAATKVADPQTGELIPIEQAVKAANLEGVGVHPDNRRVYPNDSLAAHVLGFTNRDGNGVEGIERSQDALLRGQDGKIVAEIDRQGRFLPGTMRHQIDPTNGHDLVLTIDTRLQQAADVALAKAVQDHHADHGVVIALDPQTGEILALSEAPNYNPNTPRPAGRLSKEDAEKYAARWRNSAVSDLYEPGSTLKTITASAVLQEQGLGMMNVHVFCSGHLPIGNHVIHCAADPPYYGVHGDETMRGVLKESCNIGMAQFGMHLGAAKLYEYEQKFGFLDYPGSGLPGEQKSWVQSPADFNKFTGSTGWSKIQLANIAFGQGMSVTPLQLVTAYAVVANGGMLMRPHIIRAVRQGDQETLIAPTPIRRVLDPQVAAAVRSMLGTVVQEGTGRPAQIADFSVGGKTGSAQVAGRHGYENGHYVASFVGMAPLSHPRIVILCAVFEPQGIHWGATVAAPVVHDLLRQAMLQMQIAPDAPGVVDWDDHLKFKNLKVKTGQRPQTGRRLTF